MTESQLNTLRSAIHVFGRDMQEDVAIEEMSELTKALIKIRRYPTKESEFNIREEMADVKIMLAQLEMMYGNVDDIVEQKIHRLEGKIKERAATR